MKNIDIAYKNTSEAGLFDHEFTLEALSGMENPLSALKDVLEDRTKGIELKRYAEFRDLDNW